MTGTEIPGGGGRGRLYLTLHCHVTARSTGGDRKIPGGGWRERDYTYRYTVTTRMIAALKWAAKGAILMVHSL